MKIKYPDTFNKDITLALLQNLKDTLELEGLMQPGDSVSFRIDSPSILKPLIYKTSRLRTLEVDEKGGKCFVQFSPAELATIEGRIAEGLSYRLHNITNGHVIQTGRIVPETSIAHSAKSKAKDPE